MSAYEHLIDPGPTGSGISDFLYFALVSDFSANGIKCPVPPFAALGDEVLITDDHEFPVGKGFIKALCAPSKNKMGATTIGELGSKKFMQKVEVLIPGTKKELHATIANMLNKPLVTLSKDSDCDADVYYQSGCDCNYAYVENAEFDSGTLIDGQKGYKLTISYATAKLLLYSGVVTFQT